MIKADRIGVDMMDITVCGCRRALQCAARGQINLHASLEPGGDGWTIQSPLLEARQRDCFVHERHSGY